MKKYELSPIKKILSIDPIYIKEGMEYAEKNNIIDIEIRSLNAFSEYGFTSANEMNNFILDVKLMTDTATKTLSISEHLKINSKGLEELYLLKSLKSISFQDKSFKVDFSKLPQLESAYFKYNKNITNLDTLKKLSKLLILSMNCSDCKNLSKLTNLQTLRLTRGTFTSLHGIEELDLIQRIDITHNSKLQDISVVAKLPKLERLHIEKCKLITDLSFLNGNSNIKELFIDSVDSLDFVSTMPNLESINFWSCSDGNMQPLIESKSLKSINFYPNKKHYTHTLEKIKIKRETI